MWLRNVLGVLVSAFLLTGCLTTNEVLSTAATASTALVTTSVGLPPVTTLVTSSAAGIATGILTEEPEPQINEVTNEHQAEVLKAQFRAEWWSHATIVAGVLGVVMMLLFWFIPRPRWLKRSNVSRD